MEKPKRPPQQIKQSKLLREIFSFLKSFSFLFYKRDRTYGIKYWLLSDCSAHKYICNGALSIKKRQYEKNPHVVSQLMRLFENKGHCVLVEQHLASVELSRQLIAAKTTLMGPLKQSFSTPDYTMKALKSYESMFFECDEQILTVYQRRPDKVILMLSSDHETPRVPQFVKEEINAKHKPNTVLAYEEKKSSPKRKEHTLQTCAIRGNTRRWTVQIFFLLVNVAVHNAWILYKIVNESEMSKRSFILKLTDEVLDLPVEQYELKFEAQESPTGDGGETASYSSLKKRKSSGKRGGMKACQIRHCNNNKAIDLCYKCKKACCGSCTSKKFVCCKNCS